MSGLRKVSAGEPLAIPAATYNAFVDAAMDYRNRMASGGGDPWKLFAQNGIIRVRNDAPTPQPQFAVMGIAAPLILPTDHEQEFRNSVALSCVEPLESHQGRFVVLAEPLPAGEMGRAYVAGVCPARVRVGASDGDLRSADIVVGQSSVLGLRAQGSAAILWREDTASGDVWAVVRLGSASAASDIDFSFRCSLSTRDPVEGETAPQRVIIVTQGFRQIIGGARESVPSQTFDAGTGGSVYMVWTYSNDTSAGSWGDLSYGTPPAENAQRRVVIIATMQSGVIKHRHLGDIIVLDIIDRTACT